MPLSCVLPLRLQGGTTRHPNWVKVLVVTS
jgi:hypothetical protein